MSNLILKKKSSELILRTIFLKINIWVQIDLQNELWWPNIIFVVYILNLFKYDNKFIESRDFERFTTQVFMD